MVNCGFYFVGRAKVVHVCETFKVSQTYPKHTRHRRTLNRKMKRKDTKRAPLLPDASPKTGAGAKKHSGVENASGLLPHNYQIFPGCISTQAHHDMIEPARQSG